jgi:RNA polymerase-interacting CarD/CdnL/TRCF family regulator
MFEVGDKIVHAHRGAGRIVDIEKLQCLGSNKKYYAIELLDGTETRVWVSIQDAEKGELRQPITEAKLVQVWHTLRDEPQDLPSDHHERYKIIEEKLDSGNPLYVAEAMRDLAWKNDVVRSLTTEGRRLYQRSIGVLSSEVAVAGGDTLEAVKTKISQILSKNIAARVPA